MKPEPRWIHVCKTALLIHMNNKVRGSLVSELYAMYKRFN